MGEWKKTQCAMCVLSCGMELEVENGHIVNARPDPDSPRSHGYCCRKGRSAKYYQDHLDRLDYPLKKVGDHFERISWEQAFSEIGVKANDILEKYGPKSFAFVGGATPSSQSEMVFGRALMDGIGSQYFYNAIGIEFQSSWWSHGKLFGSQMYYLEPDDHNCEVLLFWGSNSYVSGQILDARKVIREASNGTKRMVIAVDPRMSETARMADMHIMLRQGTDALFARLLIAYILKQQWEDKEYLARYGKDFDKVRTWFEEMDIEKAAQVCHVPMEIVDKFARILTTKKWGLHADLGVFMGRHSTVSNYLIYMLACVCGVAFVPGGCVAPECVVSRGDTSDEHNPKTWRTQEKGRFPVLGTYPSAVLGDELLSDKEDRLRVLFVSEANPYNSYPDSKKVREGLERMDLIVVSDIAMTETARMADYVFPSKNCYEAYDFNAFTYNYPEIAFQMKHPILPQIAERKEGAWVWLGVLRGMGLLPKIPKSLMQAAEKAAKTGDRMPYLMKLLTFMIKGKVSQNMLIAVVGETLGRAMGSPTRAVVWTAMMVSPLVGTGMVEAAGNPYRGPHKVMAKMPGLKNFCAMDAAFSLVDEHPEGAVIGITDTKHMTERRIMHKDKKIHFYCDEMNELLKQITPEKEAEDLEREGFPLAVSLGKHGDNGVNWGLRNQKINQYRNWFVLDIHPEDAAKYGIENGKMVLLTTEAGSLEIEAHYSWEMTRGYMMMPHQFGYLFEGKKYGESANYLLPSTHLDEWTGDPIARYVPCRVEPIVSDMKKGAD